MKAITKYQADDGSQWSTEAECLDHESLCARVASVMKAWPERPKNDGCRFENGSGYIQLSAKLVSQVRNQLLGIIAEKIKHDWVKEALHNPNTHPSWVARLLGDCGPAPLEAAWWRLSCVDTNTWREYGQPYYANHPAEAKQRKVA